MSKLTVMALVDTDEDGAYRKTSYRMTREDAQQRYPAAEPVLSSVAIRNLPETHGQQHSAGRPRKA